MLTLLNTNTLQIQIALTSVQMKGNSYLNCFHLSVKFPRTFSTVSTENLYHSVLITALYERKNISFANGKLVEVGCSGCKLYSLYNTLCLYELHFP